MNILKVALFLKSKGALFEYLAFCTGQFLVLPVPHVPALYLSEILLLEKNFRELLLSLFKDQEKRAAEMTTV